MSRASKCLPQHWVALQWWDFVIYSPSTSGGKFQCQKRAYRRWISGFCFVEGVLFPNPRTPPHVPNGLWVCSHSHWVGLVIGGPKSESATKGSRGNYVLIFLAPPNPCMACLIVLWSSCGSKCKWRACKLEAKLSAQNANGRCIATNHLPVSFLDLPD